MYATSSVTGQLWFFRAVGGISAALNHPCYDGSYRALPMNHCTELYRGMRLTANEFYEIRVEIVETASVFTDPYEHFPLPADDPGLARRIPDLAKRIDPPDLRAEHVLPDERGDLTEHQKRRRN